MSDELRLEPERFVAGGETLARDPDGRVVFVRGAVPGEVVVARPIERKGDWTRAVVVEVVESSAHRVEPPCPQRRAGCGGCDWQHLAVAEQLDAKVGIVQDAFRRTARLPDARITPGSAVGPADYRTTIRVVGGDDGRPSYRIDRSNDTIAAGGCLIAHPALRDLLDHITVPAGLEVALRVSSTTGERTANWDRARGDIAGLPPDVGTGPRAAVRETVAGHVLRVSAASFFQSGPAAAELLVAAVRRAAPELATATSVLDAYAGVGLFAAAAAPVTAAVTTVESSRSAIADAEHNLADRDATIVRREFGRWSPNGRRFDVVIADPARPGLAKPGVAAAAAVGAPVLVLVSCDPVSAARDTALLVGRGYEHDGTEVFDVFPHTHHVECVTRFVRAD